MASVEYENAPQDVYNLEVCKNHNLVINGGVVVHNCMDSMRYFVKTMRLAVPKTEYKSIFEVYNSERM